MRATIALFTAGVTVFSGSAALLAPWAAVAAESIEVVIATGDPLPGGGIFQSSEVPVINDAGQLVFTAYTDGLPGLASYRWDPALSQFLRIVAAGSPVPGGGVFYLPSVGSLNDAGESSFTSELEGFPATSPRMYRSDGAALAEIVRETQAAPGGNGTITGFSPGILNHAGEVAFIGYLSGTSGGSADAGALYRGDGSTLLQIVRWGEPAPGGNGSFSGFSVPALNTQGELGFEAFLTGASGGSDEGVFRADGTPGGVVQIARRGQAAPGGSGVLDLLANTNAVSLNDSGQIAFVAGLANSVGGAFIGQAVYRGGGGALTEIARSGNAAPGGGTLGSLSSPLVNEAGQVAFAATLSGGGEGIFRGDGAGALVPIVRTGQPAPDGDGTFQFLEGFAFNDAGQVAFRAYLTGGSGPENDQRLFLYVDPWGLFQLMRTGEPLLGSTVLELIPATQGSQHVTTRRGLNDHGEVAFSFVLDDFRSGIAVPEPGAYQLIAGAIGLSCAARLRRRRSA